MSITSYNNVYEETSSEPLGRLNDIEGIEIPTIMYGGYIVEKVDLTTGTESSASISDEGGTTAMKSAAQSSQLMHKESVRVPVKKQTFESIPSVMIRKYLGRVTRLTDETFFAELFNSANTSEKIQVEFECDDLSSSCQRLLAEGMPLVWAFSKARINGGVKKVEDLYIRKLRRDSDSTANRKTDELISLLTNG